MKRFWLGIAASAVMAACSGGNPFVDDTGEGGGTDPGITIPEELLGDLTSFTYDPVAKTLVVRGVNLDDTPYEATYTRKAAMDVPGYEAYTSQESSLGRHTTAYVQELDGAKAGITVSGGQFGHYFGGGAYGRDGAFDPPDVAQAGGIVAYAGSYVGLLNSNGDGGDLLPVDPSTPTEIRPTQAAEVTGSIFITADFADNSVDGIVYDRQHADSGAVLEDLELFPATIEDNGTFTADVRQNNGEDTVGTYGGIFAGTDSSAVAGTLFVEDHIVAATNSEEYGLFVLGQCGGASADPVCTQPHP